MNKEEGFLSFYPEISPNSEQMISVGSMHQMYVASYGNVQGIPVIALHGGPGSNTEPFFARFFDPQKYYIILADQRGAGKSIPKGEMRENTTQDLIGDIETIRQFFKIDKWVVFGGSWGSSLALLYAETHPEQVLALVLRGIFLVRQHDIDAFVREDCPAALFHAREWNKFKEDTTALIKKAELNNLSVESDRIYHIYYELLNQPNVEIRKDAAGTLASWEKLNSILEPKKEDVDKGHDPNGVNMGLTEATYFEHNCFIKPNQILNDIERLKNIRVYIVQGKYDLVCPPYMADELEDALIKMNTEDGLITRYDCLAGHSLSEPAIRDGLIRSLDNLASRLNI